MAPHREALKRYCSRAMATAVLIGAALIFGGLPAWGKGLIAGTLFSVLNFILMAEALPYHIGKSQRRAAVFSLGSILLRYSLMAVPMILALVYRLFHPADDFTVPDQGRPASKSNCSVPCERRIKVSGARFAPMTRGASTRSTNTAASTDSHLSIWPRRRCSRTHRL